MVVFNMLRKLSKIVTRCHLILKFDPCCFIALALKYIPEQYRVAFVCVNFYGTKAVVF